VARGIDELAASGGEEPRIGVAGNPDARPTSTLPFVADGQRAAQSSASSRSGTSTT
jgi:hypothetical protein